MALKAYVGTILAILLFSVPEVFCAQIPNSLLKEIQAVKSTVEFFEKFVSGGYKEAPGGDGGFGVAGGRYPSYPRPDEQEIPLVDIVESMGKCEPLETTVEVPLPEDSHLFTHPRCIKVKQCRGCCAQPHKYCRPAKKEMKHFRVTRLLYNSDTRFLDVHKEDIFPFEEHIECFCGCSEELSNCAEPRIYDEETCSCSCKNWRERKTCDSSNKIWDAAKCGCGCKRNRVCGSGYTFNPTTCRCRYNATG